MAVVDFRGDVACDGLGVVDAATEEVVDVGVVYLPPHVAVDLFERRSRRLVDVAAADVAFGVVCTHLSIGLVGPCEVEARELAPRHRHRHVGCRLIAVAVGAHAELLDPHVATHMYVDGLASDGLALRRHELVDHAALQDERSVGLGAVVQILILHLRGVEKRCIGDLEPASCLDDGEVADEAGAVGLLCLRGADDVQEVEAYRGDARSARMVIDEAVVRLVVVVLVHRHHGERCGSVLRHCVQMKIAHEH